VANELGRHRLVMLAAARGGGHVEWLMTTAAEDMWTVAGIGSVGTESSETPAL